MGKAACLKQLRTVQKTVWPYQAHERAGQLEFSDVEQQACILVDVLAHGINVSYDRMIGEIVDKVNGTEVKNMKHLASLISAVESGALQIDFKARTGLTMHKYIVFDVGEVKACEIAILDINKIPQWCSPQLVPRCVAGFATAFLA